MTHLKPKDLVGIWQWHKDEQEIAMLIKILNELEDKTLWQVLDSDGHLVNLWDTDIYPIGQAVQCASPFSNIKFPVVRRTFPSMVAQEIVSIQPMTAPDSKLFHLDYQYSKDKE